jgi:hypothetical protein
MASQFDPKQKQNASAFWKAYFGKFKRRVEDRWHGDAGANTPTSGVSPAPADTLPFPDRRRSRQHYHKQLR